ncbi:MAG TPA: class I SAM-dependent methyltransferase [Novosphingobium sp.]|nr:class I SAM-dependent methyltransferase [Novosphingobium sp.]
MTDFPVPRDYRTQGRHGMFPELTHDECERFNYLAAVNLHLARVVAPSVREAYRARGEPAFRAGHGRAPANRHEAQAVLAEDPQFQTWTALRRANMEQRQQAGRWVALRQADELAARASAFTNGDARLVLDPALAVPDYLTEAHHHCMPGSFFEEGFAGDVTNGANYDAGFFVTIGGADDPWLTANGEGLVKTLAAYDPDFAPRTVLDLGATIGHATIAVARAYPQAQVTAVDLGAPVLRYGLARALSMQVNTIRFVQADATNLAHIADESVDLVYSIILLHETSEEAMRQVLRESHRVLRPGGIAVHVDICRHSDAVAPLDQALRDWDGPYNNEPFWTRFRDIDLAAEMVEAGFDAQEIFHAAPMHNSRIMKVEDIRIGRGPIPPDASATPAKHLIGARKQARAA